MISEHCLSTNATEIICIRVTVCSIRFIIIVCGLILEIIVIEVREVDGHYNRHNSGLVALVSLSFLASDLISLVLSHKNLSLKTSGIIIFIILERYGAIKTLNGIILAYRIGVLNLRGRSYTHRSLLFHRLFIHELRCIYGNGCGKCAYLLITGLFGLLIVVTICLHFVSKYGQRSFLFLCAGISSIRISGSRL